MVVCSRAHAVSVLLQGLTGSTGKRKSQSATRLIRRPELLTLPQSPSTALRSSASLLTVNENCHIDHHRNHTCLLALSYSVPSHDVMIETGLPSTPFRNILVVRSVATVLPMLEVQRSKPPQFTSQGVAKLVLVLPPPSGEGMPSALAKTQAVLASCPCRDVSSCGELNMGLPPDTV